MCEHLGQAATDTMGRGLKTTMDWRASFGRDPAVSSEHFAENSFQADTSRGGGSEVGHRRNSLLQRHVAREAKTHNCLFSHRIIRDAPMRMELADGC